MVKISMRLLTDKIIISQYTCSGRWNGSSSWLFVVVLPIITIDHPLASITLPSHSSSLQNKLKCRNKIPSPKRGSFQWRGGQTSFVCASRRKRTQHRRQLWKAWTLMKMPRGAQIMKNIILQNIISYFHTANGLLYSKCHTFLSVKSISLTIQNIVCTVLLSFGACHFFMYS